MKISLLVATLVLGSLPLFANADDPGHHPAYLHALTALREARWELNHRPGDPAVTSEEQAAADEIDQALNFVKKAAFRDGKDLSDTPHWTEQHDHGARLHRAKDLLDQSYAWVGQQEDNREARDTQSHAEEHIDKANHHIKEAIHAAMQSM